MENKPETPRTNELRGLYAELPSEKWVSKFDSILCDKVGALERELIEAKALLGKLYLNLDTLSTFHRHSPVWVQMKMSDNLQLVKSRGYGKQT